MAPGARPVPAIGTPGRDPALARTVLTPEGVPLTFQLAAAGDRAAAFLLDAFFIAIGMVLLGTIQLVAAAGGVDLIESFVHLGSLFLANGYFIWFEMRWRGSTPGKRVAGIRVVDAGGGPLRAEAVIARNLVRDVEVLIPLMIMTAPVQAGLDVAGWIGMSAWLAVLVFMPLFNRDRMRVGDMVASTRVIKVPKAVLLNDLLSSRPSAAHAAAVGACTFTDAQLDTYGVYELQVLEGVLRDRSAATQSTRDAVARRIRGRLGWKSDAPVATDRFLSDFYTALRARLEKRMLFGKRKEDKYSA